MVERSKAAVLTAVWDTAKMCGMRKTQRKGDIAVSEAIAEFTKMGFDVSVPLTESAAYDLIIDTGELLKRVQVRYTSSGEVDLRRIHSNSKGYVIKKTKHNAYDWLFIAHQNGSKYLIRNCLVGRRSIKPDNNNLLGNYNKERCQSG
ncbi:MAG: group I intron-associated PD-(D/E)XK endonuclease [Patescibacteria group bacterium]